MLIRLVTLILGDLHLYTMYFFSTTSFLGPQNDRVWTCSSVETEYQGVLIVVVETYCINNLLHELQQLLKPLLSIVKMSISYLTNNPVQHEQTKNDHDIHRTGMFINYILLHLLYSTLINVPVNVQTHLLVVF